MECVLLLVLRGRVRLVSGARNAGAGTVFHQLAE